MIEPSLLIPGKTYYSFMFSDKGCTIPSITVYIYTGKNLRPDKNEWYFQNPSTYMLYGTLINYPKEFNAGVFPGDEQFLQAIYDLNGLIKKLTEFKTELTGKSDLIPGKPYYFVQYHDIKLTMPIFDSYIFIGTAKDGDEILYLFQEPRTVELKGGLPDVAEIRDADISADARSLYRFHDINRLVSMLTEIKDRIGKSV